MRFFVSVLWLVFASLGFVTPTDSDSGNVSIQFNLQFSGQPLILGKPLYYTSKGDSLNLDVLRFYISRVELIGKNQALYQEPNSYHLVDAEENRSQTIQLKNVPAGKYESIAFCVGTDSLCNVSGAMGGDLDPTLGMYWAWNTGYVNVKMEGRSNASKTRYHGFEFHIGGYKPPHQTLRRVILPIKNWQVRNNTDATIQVDTDLARFFNHIQLETTNQVMIPSAIAVTLADYYKDVFSIR